MIEADMSRDELFDLFGIRLSSLCFFGDFLPDGRTGSPVSAFPQLRRIGARSYFRREIVITLDLDAKS
jgi:hypothetical protein